MTEKEYEKYLLLNNQADALIIAVLFYCKTLHVSGIFSAHHQEFSTVHAALVSFVQVSDDRLQAESGWNIIFQPDSARKQSHNLHEAYQLPCVQWINPDDGHSRCPKYVGFYDKNKFWILMYLVGYFYDSNEVSSELPLVIFKLDIGLRYFLYDISISCKILIQKEAFFLFDTFGAECNIDTAAIL